MWNHISIVLIIIELALLVWFIISRILKKRINETIIFLVLVFIVDLALNLMPFLYNAIELKAPCNYPLEALDCLIHTTNLFIGKTDIDKIADFANTFPAYTYAYALGVLMAVSATISTAVEAFRNIIKNSFSLSRRLKATVCDLVLGNSEASLRYARNSKSVLILDSSTGKDTATNLMKEGYTVLHRDFSAKLLNSRWFNKNTQYNIISINESEKNLQYLNCFAEYKKSENSRNNFSLHLEMPSEQASSIHYEIIEKNKLEHCINTFSIHELAARTFTQEYPVAKFLPAEFITDDTSIRENVRINIFFLGFGKLSHEIYLHSIMNNQFVTYIDGEYRVLPINYHLYDTNVDFDEWNIGGLIQELYELKEQSDSYLPLPDMPFSTVAEKTSPHLREVFHSIKKSVSTPDSFSFVIIDTEHTYKNIEIGKRLQSTLCKSENFHLFINTPTSYCENSKSTTYYGNIDKMLSHEVIVNESISVMAKKLNEIYVSDYYRNKKENPDFDDFVRSEAEHKWKHLDLFTKHSNIHTAINIKSKLNLLGLDYINDGKSENISLINKAYPYTNQSVTESYMCRSKRNALLAQEHYRWNAYHLTNEYLPMEKCEITPTISEGHIRFTVKNPLSRKHACLTTFKGLTALSSYLAKKATEIDGKPHTDSEFDYIVYDEIPLASAPEALKKLDYSVIKLQKS